MANGFYLKLALNNLKRNKNRYIPYFIAAVIMVSVYFMVITIMYTKGLSGIPAGQSMQDMFKFGNLVMTIFVVLFMLYVNSFLIKQRKKEFGLYGILGLEKRHVGRIMLWENLIIYGAAVILGIIVACVFGWLIFLILLNMLKVTKNNFYSIPIEAFAFTLIIFAGLYIVISIFNLFQIHMANPIDLLKSDHQGEKKVRFLFPLTLVGLLALGWSYYTALTVQNAMTALANFTIAIVLVTLATFALFTAGSIVVLGILKKNKKFYYKTDNFISISGLFHRMKQNATGLATICILSTMVLVTVSTCVSMFLGTEDVLKMQFMNDIKIRYTMDFNEDNLTDLNNTLEKAERDNEVKIQKEINYFSCDLSLFFMDGKFIVPDFTKMSWSKMEQYSVDLSVITLEDYNRICKAKEELSDNQVLLMTKIDIGSRKELIIGDESYQFKLMDNRNAFMKGKNRSAKTEMFLVAKDKKAAIRLVKQIDSNLKEIGTEKVLLDLDGNNKDCENFISAIKSHYKKELKSGDMKMDDIYSGRITGYALYGGLLFMGVFFTIVFLCATVLIIYFKQISEGFDDKERFDTLKKVGMDDFEVKKTINKQVLIVFFLPLFGALLHVAIATRMIIKMLEVLWLYNHEITIMCVTASCIIFSIAYIIVYRLTAKTYYRIVMN